MTNTNHIRWKKLTLFLSRLLLSIIAFSSVFVIGYFVIGVFVIDSFSMRSPLLITLVFLALFSVVLIFAIFVFKKSRRYLKNGIVTLSIFVLVILSYMFLDTMKAYVIGKPVRLVSASGPLSPELPTFTHAFLRNGNLNLVIRTFFYDARSFKKPYITVDAQQNGVVHIGIKKYFPNLSTCEFLRQFEIEIPASTWKELKTLEVYNHDGEEIAPMPISNPTYLNGLIRESQAQLGLEDITEAASQGCGSQSIGEPLKTAN